MKKMYYNNFIKRNLPLKIIMYSFKYKKKTNTYNH